MDRSVYGKGDPTSEPYGMTYHTYRLTKKESPAPGCKFHPYAMRQKSTKSRRMASSFAVCSQLVGSIHCITLRAKCLAR